MQPADDIYSIIINVTASFLCNNLYTRAMRAKNNGQAWLVNWDSRITLLPWRSNRVTLESPWRGPCRLSHAFEGLYTSSAAWNFFLSLNTLPSDRIEEL